MIITLSSFLISLVIGTIFIFILNRVLIQKAFYKRCRLDFMKICILIIALRFLLPVELFYTFSIPSHFLMQNIHNVLYINIFGIEIYKTILGIWLIGCVIQLLKMIKQLSSTHFYIATMKNKEKHTFNQITYYIDETIDSPMVIGYKGIIVLPDKTYTNNELEDILMHELFHIQNKDILKKYFIQFLVCIYWWFYPIYLFQVECNLIIEMNVDFQVTQKMNDDRFLLYAKHIVSSAKEGKSSKFLSFSIIEKNTLKYRIHYLLEGYKIKHTSDIVLCSLLFIVFMSTLFVFDPYNANNHDIYDLYTSHDSYIIHDDTYHLYIDGNDLGEITNIYDPSLKKIEIIEVHP